MGARLLNFSLRGCREPCGRGHNVSAQQHWEVRDLQTWQHFLTWDPISTIDFSKQMLGFEWILGVFPYWIFENEFRQLDPTFWNISSCLEDLHLEFCLQSEPTFWRVLGSFLFHCKNSNEKNLGVWTFNVGCFYSRGPQLVVACFQRKIRGCILYCIVLYYVMLYCIIWYNDILEKLYHITSYSILFYSSLFYSSH